MNPARGARRLCLAGYLTAAVLRVALLFSYPGGYDTQSYEIVAGIEERHGNVYAETPRYNYSPLWGWLLLGFTRIGRVSGLALLRTVGLFLLGVDAAAALVVTRLVAARSGPARGNLAGLLFFSNPVSILVSSWHLQFDGLSILFLLLAIWWDGKQRRVSPATAGLLSLSLLAKHVTWFHPILFVRRKDRRSIVWCLMPYALFAASFLPFATSFRQIVDRVFRYRGLLGHYGTEALLLIPGVPEWAPIVLFGAACVVALWTLDREDLARAALRLFLVILIFLPGFASQYCVWPIALGSITPGWGLVVYTVAAAGFLARDFFGFDQAPGWLPGWYGPWWGAILWMLLEVRSARSREPIAVPVASSPGRPDG